MRENTTLLDALLELQALDRMPRIGYSMRGIVEPESISEHSFQLCMLVWALADQVPGLDRGRALELALMHDVAEVRTGDIPRTASDYLPRRVKHEAERQVVRDLLAPVGERAIELLVEYQTGESAEARFVSACDKLQLLLKSWTYERWGAGDALEELWQNLEDFPDGGFDAVRELFEELRRRRHAARSPAARTEGQEEA